MEFRKIAEEIRKLNEVGIEYLELYENEMVEFMRAEEMSPDESLQKEIIFELLDHIYGICHIAEYIAKEVKRTGTVCQNAEGEIEFDGEVLPLMTEIEVLVYDEEMGQEVWTRTYVGGKARRYLVGIDKQIPLKDITARIRE